MLSIEQLVVGIFRNRAQTAQALNELHQVGFDNRHIRFAMHGISIGKMLDIIKYLIRGQDLSACRIYNDLVKMGIPPKDARYYQSEFDAGHFIVVVLRSGVPLVATSILARNGGHIVNEHFVQFTDYGQGTSVQEPSTEHINVEPNDVNEGFAPSADYGQGTSVQEPSTKDVNAEFNDANEYFAPSADYSQGNDIQELDKDVVNA